MKSRLLYTTGNKIFEETIWKVPKLSSNQILVKSVMTGICRSDVDMMVGDFGPLPLHMQGHEGLGIVEKCGSDINDVKVGDYVATRGEPAYSDFYPCRYGEYVKVPKLEPKYILEPVACGINIITQPLSNSPSHFNGSSNVLIIGSGFMAWVAYHTLRIKKPYLKIDVVGRNNHSLWGDRLSSEMPTDTKYNVVIDLSDRDNVVNLDIFDTGALLVFGNQKQISTNFSNLLWNACTITFPSPRNQLFHKAMQLAESYITSEKIIIDDFWTNSYNRNTQWQEAFHDSLNRPPKFNRAYLVW